MLAYISEIIQRANICLFTVNKKATRRSYILKQNLQFYAAGFLSMYDLLVTLLLTLNRHLTTEYHNSTTWIYLSKVDDGNTKKMCEICLKLTRKTLERCRSGVFTINFELITHNVLGFPLLTLSLQTSLLQTGPCHSKTVKVGKIKVR